MFVVKVSGDWGSCYTDEKNDPVFDIAKAKKFKTRQTAAEYIMEHWREWKEVKKGHEQMTVYQM